MEADESQLRRGSRFKVSLGWDMDQVRFLIAQKHHTRGPKGG